LGGNLVQIPERTMSESLGGLIGEKTSVDALSGYCTEGRMRRMASKPSAPASANDWHKGSRRKPKGHG
jgi:hypothetical protein